ncbi:hypothetical protein ACOBQB_11115 [Streptomyces sp. G5(2025)]|uniref:hypothetical protein n=1 Tax=Streptomyces sp. G5(2025) TaxID=3406628 RepID=UPI003C2185E9
MRAVPTDDATDAIGAPAGGGCSVREPSAHVELASFLASYGYGSCGNPVDEAIAAEAGYLPHRRWRAVADGVRRPMDRPGPAHG